MHITALRSYSNRTAGSQTGRTCGAAEPGRAARGRAAAAGARRAGGAASPTDDFTNSKLRGERYMSTYNVQNSIRKRLSRAHTASAPTVAFAQPEVRPDFELWGHGLVHVREGCCGREHADHHTRRPSTSATDSATEGLFPFALLGHRCHLGHEPFAYLSLNR